MEPRVLILAYGNPLRSDDGIAWQVADLLRTELSSNSVEIVCAHQLTPEFAETMSHARGAIFIDARENGEPGQIHRARVMTATDGMCGTHRLTPGQLMALCSVLYPKTPEAYEVSITGECFSHGERLSAALKEALSRLAAIVIELVREIQQSIHGQSAFDSVVYPV
jgi:hydrogenase maturation protease